MPEHRYRILSTRNIEADLIEAAAVKGIDIEVTEFIHIKPVASLALGEKICYLVQEDAHVVFTSANAVEATCAKELGRNYHDNAWMWIPPTPEGFGLEGLYTPGWSIYCLEGATQKAVRKLLPNGHIVASAPNATALAEKIVQAANISSVIFFCSNKRRDELPDILREHHITVEEIVVYETVEIPVLTTEDYDGILFFSPSAVTSFFTMNKLPEQTVCFAIGRTTAKELEDFTDNRIIISELPIAEHIVTAAIFYFNNLNCYE